MLKLGSLFDGVSGWPQAAIHSGKVVPVWSSEVDEFPAAVSAVHFPDMRQLGDITKINGAEIEPVDIITAGSPCQDLSVGGKRAGLAGERSGLFMEAMRIVNEMREATNGKYPRFFVWENVCFDGNTLISTDDGYKAIPMDGRTLSSTGNQRQTLDATRQSAMGWRSLVQTL